MTETVHLGGEAWSHPGVLTPELVPTDKIEPHPQNPRRGDLDIIGASLTAHNLYQPIRVQRSTGYIVAGNHTYKALLDKGAERVPVIYLDLTDTQALEVMADDNHAADFGTYDDAALLALLQQPDVNPVTYSGDTEILAVLARRAEAEAVFSVGAEDMVDEYKGVCDDPNTEYEYAYIYRAVIRFRDQAAIDDFLARVGLAAILPRINYPLDWTPK